MWIPGTEFCSVRFGSRHLYVLSIALAPWWHFRTKFVVIYSHSVSLFSRFFPFLSPFPPLSSFPSSLSGIFKRVPALSPWGGWERRLWETSQAFCGSFLPLRVSRLSEVFGSSCRAHGRLKGTRSQEESASKLHTSCSQRWPEARTRVAGALQGTPVFMLNCKRSLLGDVPSWTLRDPHINDWVWNAIKAKEIIPRTSSLLTIWGFLIVWLKAKMVLFKFHPCWVNN